MACKKFEIGSDVRHFIIIKKTYPVFHLSKYRQLFLININHVFKWKTLILTT